MHIARYVLLTALSLFAATALARACPQPWLGAKNGAEDCLVKVMPVRSWMSTRGASFPLNVPIRSGYLKENPAVPFKGNIIYYQGLSDSMLNHLPLFQKLTNAGYRVIAFDYMGQGGSGGELENMRIYSIIEMGRHFWQLHGRELEKFPKRFVIGWSVGGLAAYVQASQKRAGAVVLLAPGLAPHWLVGEQDPSNLRFSQITMRTLTSQVYDGQVLDPHVDPIRPTSPLEAISFWLDYLQTAKQTQQRQMPTSAKGLVYLTGQQDTYMNVNETREVLVLRAPHFKIMENPRALHEIDNEVPQISQRLQEDILTFFESQPQY